MQGIYSANKVSHPGEIIGCNKVFTSPRWNSWSVQTASWWLSLEYLFLSPGSYSMWILTILFVLLMIQLNIFCFGPNHRYSHLESQLRPCFGGRLLHVCHRHIDPLRSHDIIFLGPRGPLVLPSVGSSVPCARKIWITYIQACMPWIMKNTSNEPYGSMGSPGCPLDPLGPPAAPP